MEDDGIPESERYQIEQIRLLDSEELQIEEVEGESSDDNQSNNRGYGGTSTSGEVTFDTCLASLHTYLGEVDDTHHRLAFLDGGAVLNLPLIYLLGVVLFPEAILPLRVIKPNFVAGVQTALKQLDAPCTIGVIRVYRDPGYGSMKFATTGTTAEIRQFRQLEDGSLNVVTRGKQRFRLRRHWIDSEGIAFGVIQIIEEDLSVRTPRDVVGRLVPLRNLRSGRFLQNPSLNASQVSRNRDCHENVDSDLISENSFESELSPSERTFHQMETVSSYDDDHHHHHINDQLTSSDNEKFMDVSEIQLGRSQINASIELFHPNDGRNEHADSDIGEEVMPSMQSRRGIGLKKESISQLRQAPRTFWPYWVYRMYDSYCLAEKASDLWKQIVGRPSMDGFVRKPDLLSFHIGSKIPVSDTTRQELLEIDGISYRLRREIDLLESFDRIRCKICQTLIARRSDIVVMSSEGPLGAYVNPHGAVHEIMTLCKVNGLSLLGNPIEEYSWFPGYAWTIAECTVCGSHMGWLFTASACKKSLRPRSFWGLRSSQVEDDAR